MLSLLMFIFGADSYTNRVISCFYGHHILTNPYYYLVKKGTIATFMVAMQFLRLLGGYLIDNVIFRVDNS